MFGPPYSTRGKSNTSLLCLFANTLTIVVSLLTVHQLFGYSYRTVACL